MAPRLTFLGLSHPGPRFETTAIEPLHAGLKR